MNIILLVLLVSLCEVVRLLLRVFASVHLHQDLYFCKISIESFGLQQTCLQMNLQYLSSAMQYRKGKTKSSSLRCNVGRRYRACANVTNCSHSAILDLDMNQKLLSRRAMLPTTVRRNMTFTISWKHSDRLAVLTKSSFKTFKPYFFRSFFYSLTFKQTATNS